MEREQHSQNETITQINVSITPFISFVTKYKNGFGIEVLKNSIDRENWDILMSFWKA